MNVSSSSLKLALHELRAPAPKAREARDQLRCVVEALIAATPMVEPSLRPHLIAKLPANHRS
ncbi:hypothetical protein J4G37_21995 [Microvirga sp. 3-52]|nr:hypothetical protein [Microvirga sp. 3-52]